jgi:cobalt-precorrin 5A hydrolase/precorrin-3B C17-methyltransferase
LFIAPQQFILGIGCARGCDSDELYDFVMAELRRQNVNQAAIAAIASVDLKADEPAILALAARLDVPFRVFSVA